MWVATGLGALLGAPWIVVGSMAVIAVAPVPGVIALAGASVAMHVVRRRRSAAERSESALLRSLAADVAAGLTLRQAIVTSQDVIVPARARRLCAAGSPMAEVGEALGSELPVSGRRLAALCAMSELSGAPFGEAMTAAARRSERREESRRNRRSALAQVRFSAWVVGVAPLVLTAVVVVTQGIPEPGGAIIVIPMVVGVTLQVVGTALVFVLSGRAL